MEKEKILSTISDRLGKTGLSEKTISDYVDRHLPAEGVEPDEDYFNNEVETLKSLAGQYNHDVATKVTEQVEDFKKNYKPSPSDPKSTEGTEPQPQTNKEFEDLKNRFAEMEKKLSEKQSADAQAAILKEVRAKMLEKHANDTYVLEKTLQGVTFDAKKDVSTLVEEQLARYDAELKACRGDSAKPRTATASSGNKGGTAADEYFERKKRREGWGKKS